MKEQTNSILRFLGVKHGYYPTDAFEAYRADSFVDALNDLVNQLTNVKWEADADKQKELFMAVFTETLPKFLTVCEARLSSNSNPLFLVGESLTIADFAYAGLIFNIFYNDENDKAVLFRSVFERFPLQKAYAENLQTNVFKEYLENRPKSSY